MIRARGVEGQKIAVLGLGRTGISAAKALMAGGAVVLAWDDGEPARQRAAQEGIPVHDLTSIRIGRALRRLSQVLASPIFILHRIPSWRLHSLGCCT